MMSVMKSGINDISIEHLWCVADSGFKCHHCGCTIDPGERQLCIRVGEATMSFCRKECLIDYLPGVLKLAREDIDRVIASARSNKVVEMLRAQDSLQLIKDFSKP